MKTKRRSPSRGDREVARPMPLGGNVRDNDFGAAGRLSVALTVGEANDLLAAGRDLSGSPSRLNRTVAANHPRQRPQEEYRAVNSTEPQSNPSDMVSPTSIFAPFHPAMLQYTCNQSLKIQREATVSLTGVRPRPSRWGEKGRGSGRRRPIPNRRRPGALNGRTQGTVPG
jgi:hypothetical protein